MRQKRLTQTEIAEKTGFHKPNISEWLSGKVIPRLDTALYISKTCNVPIDIFTSPAVQQAIFGKIYLKHDVDFDKRKRKKVSDDDE